MERKRRYAILFIFIYIAIFYCWLWVFKDNIALRIFGAATFSIIGALISMYWFLRPFRILSTKDRIFIILINSGLFLHLLSNLG